MAKINNRGTWAKVALTVLLAALMIVVVFQNTEPAHTKVLFGTLIMPRALLLAVMFVSGGLFGALLHSRWVRWSKRSTSKQDT